MSFHQPASDPPTKLGIYRILSPQAGLRVSPITLGAMSIGDKWVSLSLHDVVLRLMLVIGSDGDGIDGKGVQFQALGCVLRYGRQFH